MNSVLKPLVVAMALASATVAADGSLEGRISDASSRANVPGAVLKIHAKDNQKIKREILVEDGRFRLSNLPAGQYDLSISLSNETLYQDSIEIKDNEVLESNIEINTDSQPVEEVLVVGQAAQIQRALDRQRYADNMISAINADAIGQLPDNNAAEALQRIPGLSIERDQGEGRFVRVRGISPDLNSVSVNGTQVPAPESGSRAVALDVVPADLLSSLVVTKTLTPDMDANSIGGSIDVKSLSAFERDGGFYTLRAEGGYDAHSEETSPALALTGGNTFQLSEDNRFGIAGALSWENRKFGSDNVETGSAWDFDGDDGAALEEFEQRDYTIERERLGAALNLDLELGLNTSLYLRTLYSEFSDDEQRQANVIEFGEEVLNDDNELEFEGKGRRAGDTGLGEVKRELKDRKETQRIFSTTFGAQHYINDWTIDFAAGFSKASEDDPGGIGSATFKADAFDNLGFINSKKPKIIASSDSLDPNNYELDEVEYETAKTSDIQKSIKFDFTHDLYLNDHPALIKFGVKASQREKKQNINEYVFEDLDDHGFSDAQLSLANFTKGQVDYGLGEFGPKISADKVNQLVDSLNRDDFVDEEKSRIADYTINEDIQAAYVMGRIDMDELRVLAGVRYESTEHQLKGVRSDGDANFQNIDEKNDYSHVLPALHARYQLSDETQIRAAWTNSVVRPSFEQLAPSFVDDGEEAEFGNTQLKALESANYDLGIEHFTGTAGTVSAFVFYKDIKNFVYETDIAGSAGWENYDEVVTFENGEQASLTGLELAYSQKMSMLPAPFNGLMLSTNATFSESDARISSFDAGQRINRDITMPNQSDLTGNFILGFERNALMLRLAANYKSEYLLEVDDIADKRKDVYQAAQTQLDFSANYAIQENLKVNFEISNITDEPYYTYSNNEKYNTQFEDYGQTYRIGLSYSNF
jgi:TonB-dependent receptor|tara:strand:- start:1878 stop:4670 length:2793 start_codon:yes stop_codon:yes gene_type:complete